MKITRFRHNYKNKWESRMNAQSNDIFAMHLTFKKIAFGIVLKMFYERDSANWHTVTIKFWKSDYIFRITT